MAAQRNCKPVRYPEYYCPICGVYTLKNQLRHSCSPRTLGGIDAANTRATRNALEYNAFESEFCESDRLSMGFKLIDMAEEEE
tara:strand:+ start:1784 stop:2032 length:249 start_codon:yes stop_codon:yes gene_type:complete